MLIIIIRPLSEVVVINVYMGLAQTRPILCVLTLSMDYKIVLVVHVLNTCILWGEASYGERLASKYEY